LFVSVWEKDSLKPGKFCNVDQDCGLFGYCQNYRLCSPLKSNQRNLHHSSWQSFPYTYSESPGTWTEFVCFDDSKTGTIYHNVFWNPETNQCTWWMDLPEKIRRIYSADSECLRQLHCEWIGEACAKSFEYFNPSENTSLPKTIKCGIDPNNTSMVWDPTRRNCFPCHEVLKSPGKFCC